MIESDRGVITDDVLDERYAETYAQANTRPTQAAMEGFGISCQAFLGGLVPEDREARVLDIGCGWGHFVLYLLEQGYANVRGIDVSPSQIDVAKDYLGDRVQLVGSSEEFLAAHPAEFDLVVMLDVFEHIPKTHAVNLLRVIRGSLAEGGTLLLKVPNMDYPLAVGNRYYDFTHELGYTRESLHQVLTDAGFSAVTVTGMRRSIDFRRDGLVRSGRRALRRVVQAAALLPFRFLSFAMEGRPHAVMTISLLGTGRKDECAREARCPSTP